MTSIPAPPQFPANSCKKNLGACGCPERPLCGKIRPNNRLKKTCPHRGGQNCVWSPVFSSLDVPRLCPIARENSNCDRLPACLFFFVREASGPLIFGIRKVSNRPNRYLKLGKPNRAFGIPGRRNLGAVRNPAGPAWIIQIASDKSRRESHLGPYAGALNFGSLATRPSNSRCVVDSPGIAADPLMRVPCFCRRFFDPPWIRPVSEQRPRPLSHCETSLREFRQVSLSATVA